MMLPGEKFKTAQDYFDFPLEVSIESPILRAVKERKDRNTEHLDYMDFAEQYADYVVEYEKVNSKNCRR